MTQKNSAVYRQLYGDSLPIAVIGAGCRFPHADTMVDYWRRIADGEELITRFSAGQLAASGLDPSLLQRQDYVPAASILRDVDRFEWSFFGYALSEAETLDPQQRIFLMCAWEALEMAGYSTHRHNTRIGVTGSCRLGTYLQARAQDQGNLASPQVFHKLLGNDKDYLATRVAYKLGLKGPAMTVQTACSSSLVAIHLACEQIASGEADMMLAGGVAISFPQESGYFYHPGMIFSPDGHCRPFDADAAGTLPGNGAAVVLLKRLDRALEAGDAILCVIRGTAMNNDGNHKAGFTAPCVEGQRQVITDALTLAEVSPATIGMVEAHGTATPLGDPMEVAALTQAWSPWLADKRQFCALGSVKSNLGHLDTAAGVASFLKASLAVWQGQIPPSLHFTTPNPAIDFTGSPFFVPQMLLPWPDSQPIRRAAVSAFGIGGSNSHAIIEALPACLQPPVCDDAKPLPLLLSARSAAGLRTLALRHAAALNEPGPAFDAASWAATSFHARTLFPWRLLLMPDSVSGWIEQLLNFSRHNNSEPDNFIPLTAEAGITGWYTSDSASSAEDVAALTLQAGRQNACWDALIAPPTLRALLPVAPFDTERCWHSDATGYAVTVPDSDPDAVWQKLCYAGDRCAREQADSLDLSLLSEEEACIDALHRHYVSGMLQQLDVFTATGHFLSLDELMTRGGIPARYYDLMQRLMRSLSACGALQVRDDDTVVRYGALQADKNDTEYWLKRMREQGWTHLASLIERTGPNLGAMLTGDRDPVSLVFPGAGTEDVEQMYQKQCYSVYFNQIAAAILSTLAETTAAPLRILEVGAGTGGTTYPLLQALPAGCCSDYCFTDVGPLFLQRAKIKFATWPFMRFAVFDMEQPAAQQSPQRYDVIIAANVLHNASCLRQVLDNLKTLLTPGGILLIREVTTPKKLFDFVFGPLVPALKDTRRRHGELFASLQVWQSVLQEAGFDCIDAFPKITLPTAALGEHILMARYKSNPVRLVVPFIPVRPRLVQLNSDGLDASGQPAWSATHLLQAALDILPGCWRLSPGSLNWYASPQGASNPLTLNVHHQDPVLGVSASLPGGSVQTLFDVRLFPARVTESLRELALPEYLPTPWCQTGELYRWQWQPCSLNVQHQNGRHLLLTGDDPLLTDWRDVLSDAGWHVEVLNITAACAATPDTLTALLEKIPLVCVLLDQTAASADMTRKAHFMLLQRLLNAAPEGLQLVVPVSDVCQVTCQDEVTHWQHAWLSGIMAVARHEFVHVKLLMLDYGRAGPAVIADSLGALLDTQAPLLAWRTPDEQPNACWMQSQLALMPLPAPRGPAPGRHIITAGLSPLGLILIAWLADCGISQMVLLTHRPADPAERQIIFDLQARGVQIEVDSCADATDIPAFEAALERLATDSVPTGGIWHLAGVLHDVPLSMLDWETLENSLKVKIMPALLFSQWEQRLCPAQTLYFSSAATVFGPAGQAAHAAACATLEALAQHRTRQGFDSLALCWGLWEQTGNRRDPAGHLQARGMQAMPTAQAQALLQAALGGDNATCAAMRVDWSRLAADSISSADNALFARMPVGLSDLQPVRADTLAQGVNRDFSGSSLTLKVRSLVAQVLQCPVTAIDGETRLVSLGLDSLLFLELSERLKKELGLTLNAETAFNTNTLDTLVAAFSEDNAQGATLCPPSPASERHSLLRPALNELENIQGGWLLPDGDLVPARCKAKPVMLTPLQRSRWLAHDSMTRHLYVEYDKPVTFDIGRFEAAWNGVIARHDMLRATLDDEGILTVASTAPWYHIRQLDWCALSIEEQQSQRASLRERLSYQRTSLRDWPHFELCVSQTEETQQRLHLYINTLLIDIESFQVILRELNLLFHEPESVLPPLRFTACDYQKALLSLAETDAVRARQKDCLWPPAPTLPRRADTRPQTEFVIWRDTLKREQWLCIRARAEEAGFSGSAALLALYGLALRQWVSSDSFTLRLDCTDRLPLHAHVMNLVLDATTCMPVALHFTVAENFIALARACDSTISQQLNAVLPGSGELCASPGVLPVAFTSLLGVRKTYAIAETSDPLLGMPAFEYASLPHTHLHLQVLEEENALLFNLDILQGCFLENFGDILMLTLKRLLETLACLPEAWQLPLNVLLPPDDAVSALAMSVLSTQICEEVVS